MRVLVTGGIGFVGSNLANRLLHEGYDVLLFDNAQRTGVRQNLKWLREQHGKRFHFIEANIQDFRAVRKAMQGVAVVFHLAAQVAVTTSLVNPRHDFAINALGTLHVLEAARLIRPFPIVLFTSTNKVYGGLGQMRVVERETRYEFEDGVHGISESCPLDFHSPYGCSKGAADQYVRDYHRIYGLPTVVLRMSCIYGPRQLGNEDQGWVAHFARTALGGGRLTVYGDGKQVRDVLFIDDLVELMLRAVARIDRTAGEVYNVGGGPANTVSVWVEFQDLLASLLDKVPAVDYDRFRPGDQLVYISDIRKVQRQLDWTPKVTLREGLRRMISQWRRQSVPSKGRRQLEQRCGN
jgi:CDP-paratose 2-epimerase